MSYRVLARKWRPRSFAELVGQTHVLKALVNALDSDRLHHAYLFTGTRGVGKTTIARIFAKCLNCNSGVSSTPCGECLSCKEIEEGRFVDLIEVDAASRTKVEDTRELLDNVLYAPTVGRYKVYLIDEVHMLSTHSFNALLKTLEEPPPHVKFLLATTDPQKLPVTILSRCLQFSLKNMTPERIVAHLEHVLKEEQIQYEVAALWQLARAADGSMRDALSVTEQAIAFGNGQLKESEVGEMLGTIDQKQVLKIVRALSTSNAAHILHAVALLAEHSPDYLSVFDDMLFMLHRIAIVQAVPDAVDNSQGDRDQIIELAASMTAEDVQLYYQIGLVGKKDLSLAPDPRSGFEMALLRMLAFRPDAAPPGSEPLDISAAQNEETASLAASHLSSSDTVGSNNPNESGFEPESPEHNVPQLTGHSLQEQGLVEPNGILDQRIDAVDSFEVPTLTKESNETEHSVKLSEMETVEASLLAMEANLTNTHLCDVTSAEDNLCSGSHLEPYPNEVEKKEKGIEASLSQTVDAPLVVTDSERNRPESAVHGVADVSVNEKSISLEQWEENDWIKIFRQLSLSGVTGTIASHCEWVTVDNQQAIIRLRLDENRSTLYNETHRQRIEKALCDYFQRSVTLTVEVGRVVHITPALQREREVADRLQAARELIYSDERVKKMIEAFSATVLDDSIKPMENVLT